MAAFFTFSYAVYDKLPDVIPMHFGASGAPDRFAPKTLLTWMLLPIVALLLTVFITGINMAIAKRPNSINLPNRDVFRELPPEAQRPIMDILLGFMHFTNAMLILLLFLIQYLIYKGISDGSNSLPSWFIFVAIGFVLLILAASVTMTYMMQRAIDKAAAQYFADKIIHPNVKKKDE